MKTFKVCGIYRTEAPTSVVFAVQQPLNSVELPLVKKEFMVDGPLADIGTGVVLPIRSSPLGTGRPVLTCTGIAPFALGLVE